MLSSIGSWLGLTDITPASSEASQATSTTAASLLGQLANRPAPAYPVITSGSAAANSITARGGEVIMDLVKPDMTGQTSLAVPYTFGHNGTDGILLRHDPAGGLGDFLILENPYPDKVISDIELVHAQTNKYVAKGEWDPEPGLTTMLVHPTQYADDEDAWHGWQGKYSPSGQYFAKYAEARNFRETETYYTLPKFGLHRAGPDGQSSDHLQGPTGSKYFAIGAVGKAPVTLYYFRIHYLATPEPTAFFEHKFMAAANFGDYTTGDGRIEPYGDGEYVGAPRLRSSSHFDIPDDLPDEISFDGGTMRVDLPVGKTLRAAQIMAGDRHKDGRNGWATMDVTLVKSDGSRDTLISRRPVPPTGVISGGPADDTYVLQPGDHLEIISRADESAIMGIKLGFD